MSTAWKSVSIGVCPNCGRPGDYVSMVDGAWITVACKCGYNAPGMAVAGVIPPDIDKIVTNLNEMRLLKDNADLRNRLQKTEAVARAGNLLFQFGVRHDDDCAARHEGACSCGLDTFTSEFRKAWEAWQSLEPMPQIKG
jgi:hypothetical protein